jgi:hypothetical protein
MMKNFIYTIFLVFSLSIVGCSKVDIAPNKCNDEIRNDQSEHEKGLTESTTDKGDIDIDDDETITDPNHDEDEDNNSNNS